MKHLQFLTLNDVNIWEHQLFNGLTESQRAWISGRVTYKELTAKSTIYRPDYPASHVHFILQGKIVTETVDDQKNWFIREMLSTGDIFGLNGLINLPTYNEFSSTLRSPTTIVSFLVADLQKIMEIDFRYAEKVMRVLACRTVRLEKRFTDFAVLLATARFVRFLTENIEKEGHFEGDDLFYDSEITQEEIGAYIGTGRQTVTEILAELKSRNILEYNWGKFKVQNINELKKLNS